MVSGEAFALTKPRDFVEKAAISPHVTQFTKPNLLRKKFALRGISSRQP